MSDPEYIEIDDSPDYVPEEVGRGRGPARVRGNRGGSRGGAGDQAPDEGEGRGRVSRRGGRAGGGDRQLTELEQVRAATAAKKRRVASLSPSSKRLHMQQKRASEIGRVILPDAPARKRRTRIPSPVRGPRIYLPGVELPAEEEAGPSEPLVAPAYRPATREPRAGPSWEPQPGPSEVGALVGPSRVVCAGSSRGETLGEPSWEPQPGPSGGLSSAPGSSDLPILITVPADVEYVDERVVLDVAAEVGTHSTPVQRQTIALNDPNSEIVMGNQLRDELDGLDSDDDLDPYAQSTDTEPIVPSVRSAVDDFASAADLTPSQIQLLQREDDLDIAALRSIAPPSAYDFSWENDEAIFHGQPEVFTGTPGPTFPVTEQTTILDVFLKMVDVEFVDTLVEQTNKYAQQKLDTNTQQETLKRNARLNQWKPTDRPEMFSFLAILILQGLYPLPDEENYFKFNGFGTMPYFRTIMSYDRFYLLKSQMQFVDNETADQTSRTWRIDPIIDFFNTKFSSLYYPSKEIVVDESLLKWSGRLNFAQKISSKTAGVGVKTYELCESSSGYLWKFIVYAGKQKNTRTEDTLATDNTTDDTTHTTQTQEEASDRLVGPTHRADDITDTQDEASVTLVGTSDDLRPGNATASIVYQLVEPLLHRGHTLIMDNFYNSPLLARCLKRQKTDVFGTLRLNREFVPDSFKTLTKSDLRRGEVTFTYCSDVMVMVWRDSRLVGMISTYHRMRIGTANKCRLQYKPSIVLDYNKFMGGVDRKDQFLSAQPIERCRNKVWYKKVFRRLFNTAIFNSFVIYGTRHPNVSHRRFRTLLAEDLLKTFKRLDLMSLIVVNESSRPCVIGSTKVHERARCPVPGMHFPERTATRASRCWLCYKDKVPRRTAWRCRECQRNLCLPDCFRIYHS